MKIKNAVREIAIAFAGGKVTIQDFNVGIYFAQLMQNGNLINTQKFVVIK